MSSVLDLTLAAFLLAPVAALFAAETGAPAAPAPKKGLPLPGEVFLVAGRTAFIIPGKTDVGDQAKPWVWYAPTLPNLPSEAERWMFERFRDAGIAVAGMDVGESFGSPAGRALYSALYAEMTGPRGYSRKPVLLGRSRGGLMTLSWAAENPGKVAGFAGIYPVCNIASYPGVARAAGAYGMKAEELQARLAEHNPVDRLAALAEAGVPLFAIHGDRDKVVPLEANSALVKTRHTALGGTMQLIVPPGQGHNMWSGFFQCKELVEFVKTQAKPWATPSRPFSLGAANAPDSPNHRKEKPYRAVRNAVGSSSRCLSLVGRLLWHGLRRGVACRLWLCCENDYGQRPGPRAGSGLACPFLGLLGV